MADMTSTTMAVWTPEIWSKKASVTYRGKIVIVPLLDHRWEPELGVGRGDIVNIPGFTQNASPSNRGAGTGTFGTGASTTYSAVTESQIQLAIDRLYYKAHRAPVESKAQTMPNYWPMLAEGHATAIQVQVDTDVAADNTNGLDAFTTVVGTDNVDLTEDDLLTISTNLLNQNADQGVGKTVGMVSPASKQSLLKAEAFRNSQYQGSLGNLEADKGQGYWGHILNFDMYVSSLLEAGTAGKKNAFWQQEAIAFAAQIGLQADHTFNQEDGFFEQYATWYTCGFKIIKNAFGNEADGK